ncbi:Uncharacterized protein Adt_21442 [Abeliophyllum distichum]|uniref:Uncharacterized protein n=1 Tax=Abeliophyllum distichum TaxID=126358 RepID=A0ABD1SZD2_9LAMI
MVVRRVRGNNVGRTSDTTNTPLPGRSRPNLHTIPKSPSTYTESTLKCTVNHFFLSKAHNYRAPESTEYLPTGRPGELVPNALRMLNYYLLVCMLKGLEPSIDVFRLLFEMKPLDRYDCFVVFSHRNRGIRAHDHFKIPNCPTSNSGWKSRYFFVRPADGDFPFPLDWGVPPFEDFNTTPILTESEIDSLIILRAIAPLGRSMNDVLTDDALDSLSVDPSLAVQTVTAQVAYTPETSRSHNRTPVDNRQSSNIRRPIEKVAEDCQAVVACLDWEVIKASKDKSPESLERSIMVEERRVLSLRHAAFHKIRDQADKIEQTGRLLEEKSNDLLDCRRAFSEKTELLEEREARIAELEKLLVEHEDLLQQSNHKAQSLEENIGRLEGELTARGESAVEEYKCTDEYMTTVGMVGVRGREMAFRKSREWLIERYPTIDFSGAPFMPVDDEEDDED